MGMGTGTDIDMSVGMGIDMGMGMGMGERAWGDPPFFSFFFYAGQKKFTHTSRRCGFRHLSAKRANKKEL